MPLLTDLSLKVGLQQVLKAYIGLEQVFGGPLADPVQVDLTLPAGGTAGAVNFINNSGVMVGYAIVTGFYQPCKWSVDGTPSILTLPAGATEGSVNSINNSGVTAGCVTIAGNYHAAIWLADGTAIDAGTFGLNLTYLYGINDLGVVVGEKANNDWSIDLPMMAVPATYN